MDPRVKLLLLVPIFLIMMTSSNPYMLLLVFSFVIFLYVLSRIPYHRYKALIIVCLFSSLSFILVGAFFYFGYLYYPKGTVTIWLWIFRPEDASSLPILGPIILGITEGRGIVLCEEGVLWGLLTTLKFSITLFSGNLVIMTTKPKEILLTLNKLGIPIKLTFVAMTALRFVPLITEEWYTTMNAQRARGLKFKRLDVKGQFGALTATLSTLIINSIRRARILALAMETRAFGANINKVSFKELKMTRLDTVLTAVISVATIWILIQIIFYTQGRFAF
jgi:energy-coupling factor transport system permease protein